MIVATWDRRLLLLENHGRHTCNILLILQIIFKIFSKTNEKYEKNYITWIFFLFHLVSICTGTEYRSLDIVYLLVATISANTYLANIYSYILLYAHFKYSWTIMSDIMKLKIKITISNFRIQFVYTRTRGRIIHFALKKEHLGKASHLLNL